MSRPPSDDVIRIEFYQWYESQFISDADLTRKNDMLMFLAYRAGYHDGMFTQEHAQQHREGLYSALA